MVVERRRLSLGWLRHCCSSFACRRHGHRRVASSKPNLPVCAFINQQLDALTVRHAWQERIGKQLASHGRTGEQHRHGRGSCTHLQTNRLPCSKQRQVEAPLYLYLYSGGALAVRLGSQFFRLGSGKEGGLTVLPSHEK